MNKPKRIDFSNKFLKQHKKAPQNVRKAWIKRLNLFKEDPFHPLLNNHALTGELSGHRSINITGDWRALYSEYTEEEETFIVFEVIGTHSQLYG
ncbi:MAG: type II toxin-antitoxin system mRNA interferase toxin, RelE/StbE family [Patescibacteria group bacterium]